MSEQGGANSATSKVLKVLVPFAAGYLLSYLFRTINGPISDRLIVEFGLGARTLGLLTSAYFLTFAAFQVPLGILIDHFGPRRTQVALSMVAALGALVFANAHHTATLILGRAVIGLGTSGGLMAGLKALNLWVPKGRLIAMNGLYVMCGGLGAMASTYPVSWLVDVVGWRGAFVTLAAATVMVALALYYVVPERLSDSRPEPWRQTVAALLGICRTAAFWRLAPLSAMVIGTAFAVHGLWAARWMADVDGMAPAEVTSYLLAMGAGLTVGAGILGIGGNALQANGVRPSTLFAGACAVFLLIQLVILSNMRITGLILWPCFALFGAMTVLSYSMLADLFEQDLIGRANGVLNVLHLGMAFVIQATIGFVTNLWLPDTFGHYPVTAYQAAFAVPIVFQGLAFLWFLLAPFSARIAWNTPKTIREPLLMSRQLDERIVALPTSHDC